MGHFLRQLVRLVTLKEMKKVNAGGGRGWVGVSWGLRELGFIGEGQWYCGRKAGNQIAE